MNMRTTFDSFPVLSGNSQEIAAKLSQQALRILRAPARLVARQRQRAELKALDCHTLKDIGITRSDLDRELMEP